MSARCAHGVRWYRECLVCDALAERMKPFLKNNEFIMWRNMTEERVNEYIAQCYYEMMVMPISAGEAQSVASDILRTHSTGLIKDIRRTP